MIETATARARRQKEEAATIEARKAKYAEFDEKRRREAGLPPAIKPAAAPTAKVTAVVDPDAPLTVLTAKMLTKQIRDHLEGAATLIVRAHKLKAWKLLGYESWIDYIRKEFDVSRGHAYRLLEHSETVETLEGKKVVSQGDNTLSERTTRPLAGLKPTEKVKAFTKAKKAAGGNQPTGKQVAAAVAEMKPAKAKEISTQNALPMSVSTIPKAKPEGTAPAAIEHDITTDTRSFEARYTELLQAVESVFPGETRHATALRYIREAEEGQKIVEFRTHPSAT